MLLSHCSWKSLVGCFISEWVGLFVWVFWWYLFVCFGWVFVGLKKIYFDVLCMCVCLCLRVLFVLLEYMDRQASGPNMQKRELQAKVLN